MDDTFQVKVGLAEMLRGGVIMDVINAEQAKIAEEAGACAVMALERVPADIRAEGGVARMCAIEIIEQVQAAVSIPVMAKCRIGHFVEARMLEAGRIRAEAQRLLDEGFELPFKKGTFRYDASAVLDEVGRRLQEPPFDEVLEKAGIDDPATAGLKVITTLDPDAQRGAIYGLWHHLTEVGTWMEGLDAERFKVQGSRVARVRGGRGAAGHAGYRQWLTHTFRYAGTQSLKFDSEPVGDRPYRAGDFFVQPGGPGHAVVLLDLAAHPDGRVAALVGQGFMPAEDLHVLAGGHDRVIDGVWFLLPTADRPHLATPSGAPFHRDEARRFSAQQGEIMRRGRAVDGAQ